MADNLSVTIEGLTSFTALDKKLARVPLAARRAVNFALNRARTESSRRIREQIAFAARYLSGADGKINLVPATGTKMEGRLTAKSRPTSLARFVSSAGKSTGARVQVKPGG